jgi:hypothetical protein
MGTRVYLASVIDQIFEHDHDIKRRLAKLYLFQLGINAPLTSPRPLPHSSSVDGRVAGTTLRAMDEETVHLVVLGVQQDGSTVSAYIVNCVRAGDENGRCTYYIFDAPGFHYSQCSLWIFHDRLFSSVRAHRAYRKGPAPAKAKRGNFQVQSFYATPTRLASILGGPGHQISQQGCCTSVRSL